MTMTQEEIDALIQSGDLESEAEQRAAAPDLDSGGDPEVSNADFSIEVMKVVFWSESDYNNSSKLEKKSLDEILSFFMNSVNTFLILI